MTTNYNILQLGDDRLRQCAEAVTDFSCPAFEQLLDDLLALMLAENGVGIAAPQIGVSLQVLIIASRPNKRYPHAPEMAPIIMINPSFSVINANKPKDWEGCLSVPGIRALVPRYQAIQISYQNIDGGTETLELHDFPARVFQHEYDHLQGLVYLDRVENNQDIVAESEFFKRLAA